MNRPPERARRIPHTELADFATRCLKAAGMRSDHATQLGQLLTSSDLRGVHSHGTRAIPGYCSRLRKGDVNPNPQLKTLQETDVMVQVDGDGGLGYAPMMEATEGAIAKAKKKGVGVGGTIHIGHYGSAGHYVRRAMEEDCTAFSVQGSHPERFGEGGGNEGQQSAYWGNPPLCFGLPSDSEPPLVLDGATCILADYQRGEAFDALQEKIPAAFFKSMGYTGIGTALGGAFVGTNSPRDTETTTHWPLARQGGFILVMDISLFAPAAQFLSGVDHLVAGVRETMAPLRGYTETTLPGTIEDRLEKAYRADGIPVALEDVDLLERTGKDLGVIPFWS